MLCLLLPGCTKAQPATADTASQAQPATESVESASNTQPAATESASGAGFEIPEYNGQPSVEINGNKPNFTEADLTTTSFEHYSDLDALGRCGVAYACIGRDLMPTGERDSIREIHPSGWHSEFYDFIEDEALYNRCHLIAYCLTAESANEKNLITGTHYMNHEGMNPYEKLVAKYLDNHAHHVLYRVTPIFEGDNLVASGVEMEAMSVEDDEICFHVYCFNVQPGVIIDYATGDSQADPDHTVEREKPDFPEGTTYVLNTHTHKFHLPDCDGVYKMQERNREATDKSREQLIEDGYSPCGSCKP